MSSTGIINLDSPRTRTGSVEITGTEAVLSFPDPDYFDGPLRIVARATIRRLLTEFPQMPATVIAERIGWEQFVVGVAGAGRVAADVVQPA